MRSKRISKTLCFQLLALTAFTLMAMSSASSKEFNEGFRDGYNAVYDATSMYQISTPDSITVGEEVASIDPLHIDEN